MTFDHTGLLSARILLGQFSQNLLTPDIYFLVVIFHPLTSTLHLGCEFPFFLVVIGIEPDLCAWLQNPVVVGHPWVESSVPPLSSVMNNFFLQQHPPSAPHKGKELDHRLSSSSPGWSVWSQIRNSSEYYYGNIVNNHPVLIVWTLNKRRQNIWQLDTTTCN